VEELEGEEKLEPPLPGQKEEEREAEYQRLIDKLNNTLSAALEEVKEEEEEDSWISAEGIPHAALSICIICLYCNSSHI
jgi:hypothetical protein